MTLKCNNAAYGATEIEAKTQKCNSTPKTLIDWPEIWTLNLSYSWMAVPYAPEFTRARNGSEQQCRAARKKNANNNSQHKSKDKKITESIVQHNACGWCDCFRNNVWMCVCVSVIWLCGFASYIRGPLRSHTAYLSLLNSSVSISFEPEVRLERLSMSIEIMCFQNLIAWNRTHHPCAANRDFGELQLKTKTNKKPPPK